MPQFISDNKMIFIGNIVCKLLFYEKYIILSING